jgi:hypothetical protein
LVEAHQLRAKRFREMIVSGQNTGLDFTSALSSLENQQVQGTISLNKIEALIDHIN